ncbi:hypothetical protein [Halomicrobium salinisoli]|uniref:hypothetical protein n=1 Tax=Halomicrobium salinisoli TaxID=2878391 RepID=UPI001CF0A260|nr:hypothetical protein [Halomicrobium salinisoli]
MRRRALLAAVPASLSLSGCIDDSSGEDLPTEQSPVDGTDTETEVRTADGSPTDAAAEVTVRDVTLQYGLVRLNDDAYYVGDAETAVVRAEVDVDGALPRDAFALRVDEASAPAESPDDHYRYPGNERDWYDGDGRGALLFSPSRAELAGEPPELRLTWPGGEHVLDDGLAERLVRGPPTFDATVDAPAEVPADEADGEHEVTVEATNRSDGPARFVAGVNRTGPQIAYTTVERLTALVEPGETATVSLSDDWMGPPPADRVGDGESDVTYELAWNGGFDSTEIRVV